MVLVRACASSGTTVVTAGPTTPSPSSVAYQVSSFDRSGACWSRPIVAASCRVSQSTRRKV
ncbi:hypothetical protein [Amycolatopsis samaneae]|uniref:Uncharacterized protein n=1 Tax=Amycolatopsis samaneae TaxID=664691 RepID=A0ABW5GMU6_9PSEU